MSHRGLPRGGAAFMRGRGRGNRGRGGGGDRYSSSSNDTPGRGGGRGGGMRHPPGLKGREIGLWYAKHSQAKMEKIETRVSSCNLTST